MATPTPAPIGEFEFLVLLATLHLGDGAFPIPIRALIEERTGRAVVHLCYPWHAWGPTTRRLARDAGYRTAFCGKVRSVPITLAGGDPMAIARIGEDYLELLPGRGRTDLTTILRRKWDRRARRGT